MTKIILVNDIIMALLNVLIIFKNYCDAQETYFLCESNKNVIVQKQLL